jgi:hypothetical protein
MKTHSKPPPHIVYWVKIPLTFTYRSLTGLHLVETHSKDLDLPILSSHIKEIERLVRETHVSAEQALTSLVTAHIEEKKEQFHQEEPEYHLTIIISGELTCSKELLEHLKL